MIESLVAFIQAGAANLSPLGLDWWITLGGWVPGFSALIIAIIIWFRSKKRGDQ